MARSPTSATTQTAINSLQHRDISMNTKESILVKDLIFAQAVEINS